MNECLIAYCTSSALLAIPSSFMISYLWKKTVLIEILRMDAISFGERPSASICNISRCRGVRCLGPLADLGCSIKRSSISRRICGVT